MVLSEELWRWRWSGGGVEFGRGKLWRGLSATIVSPAKAAEPIEMLFGMWTQVGPRKHVFDGGHIGPNWRI